MGEREGRSPAHGIASLRGIWRTRDGAPSGAKSGGRAVTQKASLMGPQELRHAVDPGETRSADIPEHAIVTHIAEGSGIAMITLPGAFRDVL
jgi:hypothetical protein